MFIIFNQNSNLNPLPKSVIIYDWILVIYLLVSVLLVLMKNKSEYKFLHFTRLILSDTYLKTYKVDSLFKGFHFLLNVITVLFFPLLLQLLVTKITVAKEILFSDYVKYLFFFTVAYSFKMVLQLFFAKTVNYQKALQAYIFQKQTYFAYITFLSLLPVLLFVFSPLVNNVWLYVFVIVWVVVFLLSMLLVVNHFKEVILSRLLYFILYICAFEISPIVGVIYFTRL